jgi:hypothetical protein
MSLAVWKISIFGKRCAIFWREERKRFGNAHGDSECGWSVSEGRERIVRKKNRIMTDDQKDSPINAALRQFEATEAKGRKNWKQGQNDLTERCNFNVLY